VRRGRRGGERRGNARGLDGDAERLAVLDGLGHQVGAGERDRDQREQDEVREKARLQADLHERGGDEHAEADADGRGSAVGERDAGGVAAGMQVEQRRACRTEGCAGGDSLEAGDEESQAAESARRKRTVAPIRPPRARSRTGRRPTSSDTRPASSSVASTPKA
jgi:hypothetical protein